MRRIFLILAFAMAIYASLLMPLHPNASAQDYPRGSEAVRIAELERRTNSMESERFGERLARMEENIKTNAATTDSTNKMVAGIFVAIIIMLIERALVFKRRRSEPSE